MKHEREARNPFRDLFKDVEAKLRLLTRLEFVSPVGGSTVASHDAVFKFTRLGIECQAFDNLHGQRLAASILHEGDAVLFISYSGETKDLLKTIAVAKKRKAFMMAITKYGDNTISRSVELNVHHASVYEGAKTNSTRSRIVQLNVIDILFIYLSKRRSKQLEEFYRITDGGRLSERNLLPKKKKKE